MRLRTLLAAGTLALLSPLTASADTCSVGPPLTCTGTLGVAQPALWILTVGAGGGGFQATTSGTAMDTQLFLFDALGNGLFANDDDSPDDLNSTINADLGSDPTPRIYYLAVDEWNKDPLSGGLPIFPADQSYGSVAALPGAGAFDVNNPEWSYWTYYPGGPYTITFSGVESAAPLGGAVPEPATLTLLGAGLVGIARRVRRRQRSAAVIG